MKHTPKHLKQDPPYQGWAPVQNPPSFMDEADQLLAAQVRAGDTPPMGFPVFRPQPVTYSAPRPGMSQPMKLVLASFAAVACLFTGAILILAVAFALGSPPPAQASDPVQRQPVRQVVVVDGDQLKVKARQLCPTEDSCDIDYEGRGTWTITRVTP